MAESPDRSARSGIVVSIGRDRYRTEILAAGHRLLADEPAGAGGSGEGPGPYDLLLASLGACKAMTLRMYADRKGWPLERVGIVLRHQRRHAEDCVNCEDPRAMLDHIDVELELAGELSPEQRARLREIADRCPVHRTLASEIRIGTELVDGA